MAEVEMKWHDCPIQEFDGLLRVHPTGRYTSCFGTSLWFSVEYQMDGHKVDMTWWLTWRKTEDWILTHYERLREQGLADGLTEAYEWLSRRRGEEE